MKRPKLEYEGSLFDLDDQPNTPPTPTKMVTLYIAVSRNEETKAGGWAATILDWDGQTSCLSGGEYETSSYRLEIVAAVAALRTLQEPTSVQLVIGDDYLFNGLTKWLPQWIERGWKNIKHRDVWEQAAELLEKHTIRPERIYPKDNDLVRLECQQLARSTAARIAYYD